MSQLHRWLTGLFVLLLVGGFQPTPVEAQSADDPANKKTTITWRDLPLRSGLDNLFAGSGLQYVVDSNVPDVPLTLNLREVSIQQALRTIISSARSQIPGLALRREGDVYLVQIKPPTPPPASTEEAPPEDTDAEAETTWEKIPIQFNSVLAIMYGLASGGFGVMPTEAQVSMGGMGGGMGGGRGMGGGMMGGMGGMGGGMGGGMMGGMGGMGGGMMGGMGGMGGGFGGGMGGFGGGMGGGSRF